MDCQPVRIQVVEPEVLPEVVPLVVEPEVLPEVLPVVVEPEVLPLVDMPVVLPEVEPLVDMPSVLPEVEPLVVPAFSEAVQEVNIPSDALKSRPAKAKERLFFMGLGKEKMRKFAAVAYWLYGGRQREKSVFASE